MHDKVLLGMIFGMLVLFLVDIAARLVASIDQAKLDKGRFDLRNQHGPAPKRQWVVRVPVKTLVKLWHWILRKTAKTRGEQ